MADICEECGKNKHVLKRADCPECGKNVAITQKGNYNTHNVPVRFGHKCKGSLLPVDHFICEMCEEVTHDDESNLYHDIGPQICDHCWPTFLRENRG